MLRIAGAALLVGIAVPAAAQRDDFTSIIANSVGTFHVTPTPQFTAGKLTACTVEFSAVLQDWVYKQGGYIRVGGSFGYHMGKNGVGIALKVTVHDFDTRTAKLTPSAPATVYFVAADGLSTTAALSRGIQSDTPGGFLVVLPLNEAVNDILMDAFQQNKITIAFARRPGGMDIKVPLDLTVKDTDAAGRKQRDPANVAALPTCALKLFDAR